MRVYIRYVIQSKSVIFRVLKPNIMHNGIMHITNSFCCLAGLLSHSFMFLLARYLSSGTPAQIS